MDNHTYWIKRQEAKYLAGEKLITDYYKGLEKAFKQAQKEITNVVNAFYIRYANENNVTFQEAQKLLTRAEIGELQEFIDMAKEYMGEYNLELNNMSIKARITRYEALQKQIDVVLQKLYATEYEQKGREILQNAYTESYYRTWWNIDCYKGFHSEFAQINPVLIDELINYPFNGANYSARLWKQKDHMLYKLNESLTTMLIQGRNPKVLAPEFAKQFDAKTKDAYRLLHTEGSFIMEQATQKMYIEDGIEKYEWSATLDLRTCHDCSPLDGEVFDVGKGIVGETLPPKHNRCRCTTLPYFNDVDKYISERTARNPETGKSIQVWEDMKYDQWYDRYVKGVPEAELAEKKLKGLYEDRKQWNQYKEVLGKEVPQSIEAFQELKYTDNEKWKLLNTEYRKTNSYNTIIKNEPDITKDLVEISNRTSVSMVGLEYRLKTKESFIRKVNSDSMNSFDGDIISKTISNTNDVIRYTYQSDKNTFVDSYKSVCNSLVDKGYKTIKVKNTWLDKRNPYNGVNCIFEGLNGQRFEVQFHTPESFNLKNGDMHKLYEKMRLDTTSQEEKKNLTIKMFELSSKLERPLNIEQI
ncbi:head morphogenesis protein [Sporanaerobium hydrogeniformans]|uniref:Head morphogenesis protein n=1 Tax=Sporanaerobium hydrogeniformans TaxID=3072179 RepID=A0AC61DG20_9FIRM|nr:minor capsid protein [Sporanaerobium hydrogeniformans]PHV72174.1 head morphogenesis protein [Sporanaerobium hydrogeniformans]